MSDKISCSESSSLSSEHLYGTAPRVDNWFLLEYTEHWEKEALEKSLIPEEVKAELYNFLKSFKNSRIQLIKKDDNETDVINFYYIKSVESEPKSYHFKLNNYKELLELDFLSLVEKGDINDSETDEKIVLVCTHGAYDSCCGKYGNPVFSEIAKSGGLNVWKSTHVGAHRFSANIVFLPEGIYYGRVASDNIGEIVNCHLKGEIYLDNFRGRCYYSQPSQVSDYFLRKKIGKYGFYDLKWEFERDRDLYIAVEFGVKDEGLVYSVNSIVFNNALEFKTTCSDETPTKIHQFYFYSIIPYTPKNKEKKE